ncbi:MAG: hypothetical protein RM338_09360, partial [Nostoc sp. DedQUE12a]|nr:hypothetical protein [Nostoc sp. DedQUE12a]
YYFLFVLFYFFGDVFFVFLFAVVLGRGFFEVFVGMFGLCGGKENLCFPLFPLFPFLPHLLLAQ